MTHRPSPGKPAAGSARVVLTGDLDVTSGPALRRQLEAAATSGARRIVVDLGELEFLDCSGLGLLLSAQEQLGRQGRELYLRRGRPAVQRVFGLTGTLERFQFED